MTLPPVVRGLPEPGRTLVVGVLNVTPDSFSDGGRWFGSEVAVERGLALAAQGADIVDVGGESTRPGAVRPELGEELRRVVPVVRALTEAGVVVSADTMRAEVAAGVVEAGARMINDVSGGLADPDMLATVAALDAAYVCMHWRGHSTVMQERTAYADVVVDVAAELRHRLDAALEAGIAADRLVVDAGLGFAKTAEHNWELLRRLDVVEELGVPQLVGASRKAFLGALLADADGQPRPAAQRDDATTALTALLASRGVWGVRVHAVRASRDAVAVVQRLTSASSG